MILFCRFGSLCSVHSLFMNLGAPKNLKTTKSNKQTRETQKSLVAFNTIVYCVRFFESKVLYCFKSFQRQLNDIYMPSTPITFENTQMSHIIFRSHILCSLSVYPSYSRGESLAPPSSIGRCGARHVFAKFMIIADFRTQIIAIVLLLVCHRLTLLPNGKHFPNSY